MARYNHGLQGRERYLYQREREDRLFQRQLLDDFFEPDRSRRPARRFIPIRRRSDFATETVALASAAEMSVAGMQHTHRESTHVPCRDDRTRESAIRFDNRIRSRRPTQRIASVSAAPGLPKRKSAAFSWRGFLTGCAMGGMAAAVVLLVLQTVTG
jgi:hypothetical protein